MASSDTDPENILTSLTSDLASLNATLRSILAEYEWRADVSSLPAKLQGAEDALGKVLSQIDPESTMRMRLHDLSPTEKKALSGQSDWKPYINSVQESADIILKLYNKDSMDTLLKTGSVFQQMFTIFRGQANFLLSIYGDNLKPQSSVEKLMDGYFTFVRMALKYQFTYHASEYGGGTYTFPRQETERTAKKDACRVLQLCARLGSVWDKE